MLYVRDPFGCGTAASACGHRLRERTRPTELLRLSRYALCCGVLVAASEHRQGYGRQHQQVSRRGQAVHGQGSDRVGGPQGQAGPVSTSPAVGSSRVLPTLRAVATSSVRAMSRSALEREPRRGVQVLRHHLVRRTFPAAASRRAASAPGRTRSAPPRPCTRSPAGCRCRTAGCQPLLQRRRRSLPRRPEAPAQDTSGPSATGGRARPRSGRERDPGPW